MNQELLRLVDGIARDKNIDRETMFDDLEMAMVSAIRKAYAQAGDIEVRIDRQSGSITASVGGTALSMRELGRIAAQTAKQVMIQKIREAERESIHDEYVQRRGEIVTGKVVRREGGTLIVESGRAEAILPRGEQIPGETHMVDDRVRAMVLEVRDQGSQVRIVLSRTHPDFIRRLFDLEVPEVAEGIIEIRALAREAGYRTKVAVGSLDTRVDAVGACVGIRGSRIRSIVDELGGEKIDIVRWDDSSKILIANALKPAEVYDISLCFELGRAIVVVTEDQLSLAIGKRGQNVRLAARLTQWDIDILTPAEFNAGLDTLEKTLLELEGVDSQIVSQMVALGIVNVLDLEEVGTDPLVKELEMEQSLAENILRRCGEEARAIAKAQAQRKEAEQEQASRESAESAEPAGQEAQADKSDSPETQQTEQEQASEESAEPAGQEAQADESDSPETQQAEQEQASEESAEPAGQEAQADKSDSPETQQAEQESAEPAGQERQASSPDSSRPDGDSTDDSAASGQEAVTQLGDTELQAENDRLEDSGEPEVTRSGEG